MSTQDDCAGSVRHIGNLAVGELGHAALRPSQCPDIHIAERAMGDAGHGGHVGQCKGCKGKYDTSGHFGLVGELGWLVGWAESYQAREECNARCEGRQVTNGKKGVLCS